MIGSARTEKGEKMTDLISRRAAIKAIDDLPNCYNGYSDTYDKAYIIGTLEEVPSIEPKKVVKDYCRPRNLMVVTAEDFHRLVEQMLQTIDVPDRKFGEWIAVEYNDGTVRTECSVCGYGRGLPPVRHYCPNCGAKMDEVSDE
jgi:hypothetical protein